MHWQVSGGWHDNVNGFCARGGRIDLSGGCIAEIKRQGQRNVWSTFCWYEGQASEEGGVIWALWTGTITGDRDCVL